MKRLTAFVLSTLLAMPVVAEEVNKTLDAASDGDVYVSNISGSITVKGWSRNEVEVTGELGRNVEELIFERSGNKVTIKVKVPRNSGRGIESDLDIQVPEGSSIDVGTVSADIEVEDVHGEQKLNTVSGDIETEGGRSDISAGAVSGDIEVDGERQEAETRANTVSGDVTLFRVAGTVSAESVSGDVIVDEGSFDRVGLNTVNGEILFQAELRDGGKLKAETVNGDVDLEFAGDVSGRFEVDTFNGDIDNCFGGKPERTSKYTPGWEWSHEDTNGNARVDVSTLNGDVTICR
ncbi:MAG: DUF4097 family beta strand repeat protein [Gammaproteobacteria bacterium]|jgi:DUF4097 and DUF4098 domain-containing protein YvlB|nr:DUF4097 family beta strand repeat protein [Gammaproteobacteria bacterium]